MPWNPTVAGATAQQDTDNPVQRPANNVVGSAARTTNGNSGSVVVNGAERVNVLIDVTAVSGTSPTLALALEWSHDGTTWFPAATPDTLGANITAATKRVHGPIDIKAPFTRVTWTLGGTTPSFTFAIHFHLQDNA